MTFNDVFLAQHIASQRLTEAQRAWRNGALRAAREAKLEGRRQRRR